MHDALAHVMALTSTPREGRIQGRDRQSSFHTVADRVPGDPARVDVFHGAQLHLAFPGAVFSDVGQPHLVHLNRPGFSAATLWVRALG